MTSTVFEVGQQLVTLEEYRQREKVARLRAYRLECTHTWIGEQTGIWRQNVSLVLGQKDEPPKRRTEMLPKIERLLERVERGELSPHETEREAA